MRDLYQKFLGVDYEKLPEQIRQFQETTKTAHGEARVTRNKSALAQLIGFVLHLPEEGENVPAFVRFEPLPDGREKWTRQFGNRKLQTVLKVVEKNGSQCLTEQFGPFIFEMATPVSKDGLDLSPKAVKVLGIPLPLWLAPNGSGTERIVDGRYTFNVQAKAPLVGVLMTYQGWLEPDEIVNEQS